jgi:hypothetical protein
MANKNEVEEMKQLENKGLEIFMADPLDKEQELAKLRAEQGLAKAILATRSMTEEEKRLERQKAKSESFGLGGKKSKRKNRKNKSKSKRKSNRKK